MRADHVGGEGQAVAHLRHGLRVILSQKHDETEKMARVKTNWSLKLVMLPAGHQCVRLSQRDLQWLNPEYVSVQETTEH